MGHKWDKLGDNEQEQADNRKTTGDDLEATMGDTVGDNWEKRGERQSETKQTAETRFSQFQG